MLTAETIRRHNLLGLMKIMRKSGIITNHELVDITGLTQSTLHILLDELTHNGIVSNVGMFYGANGRPAQRYDFNSDTKYVFGVLLSFEYFEIVLYDLSYNLIAMEKRGVDVRFISAEDTIGEIMRAVTDILDENQIARKYVAGIGFNIPGPVDSKTGTVLDLAHLQQWTCVPLRDIIESRLDTPVFVEKDACASALGMKWYAGVPDDSTLAYLSFVEGLGMSLLINNRIYRGQNRMMGEMGHISIDKGGALCNCGERGCLELYASDLSMMERIASRLENTRRGVLWEECHGDPRNQLTLDKLKRAALKRDPVALVEMEFTASHVLQMVQEWIRFQLSIKHLLVFYISCEVLQKIVESCKIPP